MKKIKMKVDFDALEKNVCIVNKYGYFIFKPGDLSHSDLQVFATKIDIKNKNIPLITGTFDNTYTRSDLKKEFNDDIRFISYQRYLRHN
jgi:hypothetical protein